MSAVPAKKAAKKKRGKKAAQQNGAGASDSPQPVAGADEVSKDPQPQEEPPKQEEKGKKEKKKKEKKGSEKSDAPQAEKEEAQAAKEAKAADSAESSVESKSPSSSDVKVPNVKPKTDPKEQKRMEAMLGNLRQQASIFVTDEANEVKTFVDESQGGALDLKAIPSVYFKKCKNGKYTFDRRTVKLLIEDCEDCTVTVNCNILTNTIEMWKCKNVTLNLNFECRTLQLDMLNDCKINFAQLAHLGGIIWNQIHDSAVTFGDREDLNFKTGFKQMLKEYPDSHEVTDQFIIRLVNGKMLHERCIRLKNGHLSTEREAIEWDKRNEVKKQEYLDAFLKEAGVHLNKSKEVENRDRNAPCTCGSGKKFKKCCMGKKKAAGSDVVYK